MEHVGKGMVIGERFARLIVGFGVAVDDFIYSIREEEWQIHGLDVVFLVDVAVHEAVDEKVVDGRCHHFHALVSKPFQHVQMTEGVVLDVDFTYHADAL